MKTQKQLEAQVIRCAKELEKLAKLASGNPEKVEEYLCDVLDVEMSIGGNLKYRSVVIQLALGGPNIYFDSATGEVKGYWGTDRYVKIVSNEVCYAVDDYYEEFFESCR